MAKFTLSVELYNNTYAIEVDENHTLHVNPVDESSDLNQILQGDLDTFQDGFFWYQSAGQWLDRVRAQLSDDKAQLLVGYCGVKELEDSAEEMTLLVQLCIAQWYRGRGYEKEFWTQIEPYLQNYYQGKSQLHIKVQLSPDEQKERPLWTELGFKPTIFRDGSVTMSKYIKNPVKPAPPRNVLLITTTPEWMADVGEDYLDVWAVDYLEKHPKIAFISISTTTDLSGSFYTPGADGVVFYKGRTAEQQRRAKIDDVIEWLGYTQRRIILLK